MSVAPMRHHTVVEHPGQSSVSTGWRESRRAQGYEQLNYYHSYISYLPTYRFGDALDQW